MAQLALNLTRVLGASTILPSIATPPPNIEPPRHQVLILGGGVAGIMAARELYRTGVQDFLVVEARGELGGRLVSRQLSNGVTVEMGANWIEGLHSSKGFSNPIWGLVKKHGVKVAKNDWNNISFYDEKGLNCREFPLRHDRALKSYRTLLRAAGEFYGNRDKLWYRGTDSHVFIGDRIRHRRVDTTARTGYKLSGSRFVYDQYDHAAEYYHWEWEYGQTPEQSSWIATANNFNRTFDTFGTTDRADKMCIDQRGFKHFLLAEANTFLRPNQTLLNSFVKSINYSDSGVKIALDDGRILSADHVIVTFSVGVLQNEDVVFHPRLPEWKTEAIESMKMATYTKIFLVFDHNFWHDTEMGLYADPHKRGHYPVWQNLDHERFFPEKHIYFVTVTGDESERIETMTDNEVQAEVLQVLRKMYPRVEVPEPTSILFERWFKNKLFRGSWSHWPPSFYIEHMSNLRASLNRTLHFAGEATSLDFYGYLHGAYFEGLERGAEIAQCILSNDCARFPTGGDFEDPDLLFPIYLM